MSSATPLPITDEEYLYLERRAEFKHELIDGVVVAMAGVRRAHSLICTNLSRIISSQLLDKPQFVDNEFDTLTNPTVIIEILSPSTEKIDRGPKFHAYLKIPSLKAYLMIAQDRYSVEIYSRQGEGWHYQHYQAGEKRIEIESIGVRLTVAEIYHLVVFPPGPDPNETSTSG